MNEITVYGGSLKKGSSGGRGKKFDPERKAKKREAATNERRREGQGGELEKGKSRENMLGRRSRGLGLHSYWKATKSYRKAGGK